MERQQRHSVEFRLITLCVIFFHKKLCDSSGELAEIVGGKDRRAVISAGSLEGTPLERPDKELRPGSFWLAGNQAAKLHRYQFRY